MLLVSLLVAVGLLLATYVFMWLARHLQHNEAQRPDAAVDVAKNVDKLRGFHGLAKVPASQRHAVCNHHK